MLIKLLLIQYAILIKLLANFIKNKPAQDCPFPVYPVLHIQVKLPAVLVQVALESQL